MNVSTRKLALIPAFFLLNLAHAQEPPAAAARDLFVTVGKSLVVDSPVVIQRVAVADSELAEAIAVTPREVLVNGKTSGETSLIIWQQGGNRLIFDLNIRSSTSAIEAVRGELAKELPGQDVSVSLSSDNKSVYLRGTVKNLVCADRAAAISATLGKVVNLLQVEVGPVDAQVLLKVRFANVDRSASKDLGANLFSTGGLGGTVGSVTTGAFASPNVQHSSGTTTFTLSDALNLFLFRPDLNLGATLRLLQSRNLLEILAEPNVLAIDGKQASFLAGGEFPFPILQGGGAAGAVTIQWREFGIRLNFLPKITPRGTIRLQVTPEVSSLDFANGLTFQGFHMPAISTRRVQTEIELESGQTFAIGGLLDNRVTETWSKVPGIGDIPLLGKIFQSYSKSKNNSELLVMVTPELVRPIPADQQMPQIPMPQPMLEGTASQPPRTPAIGATGPVPNKPPRAVIPVEEMIQSLRPTTDAAAAPALAPSAAMVNPPAADSAPTQASPSAPAPKQAAAPAPVRN
jgi:pilus assembly protein CpaC